ncbi:hypothetical protein pdam_00023245 [Pocillopora damicornis]|uniref:Uncharacterized protein n=1 Tax=Pocillopora damicornis TaxID=46731 RepID=A0A3M6ULJ0_POCDA|nr:hypothetical protein pdam_00023245 [Pocillopora damicornis]
MNRTFYRFTDVLAASIMGVTLSGMQRPSLTLMNALQSVSVACAAVSAITVYHYLVALSSLMALGYTSTLRRGYYNKDPFFFDSDQLADVNFTAKQNSMVAVSSLIIICSIIEIILAVAAIRSSNITGQSSQEQQVSICYGQLEAGQVPIQMQGQPTSVEAQPVVAIPESGACPGYTNN